MTISGPHSDYYVLMDEQSDLIFSRRLAEHIREVGVVASGMLEIWIDESSKQVWYIFGGSRGDRFGTEG